MDWQTLLTAAIASACAVWLGWTTLRPFVARMATACGLCAGCPPAPDSAPPAEPQLLQIEASAEPTALR